MIAEWCNLDGQIVPGGEFSLTTKSLYKAAIDTAMIVGGEVGIVSFNWATVIVGNKRLLVSAVHEG